MATFINTILDLHIIGIVFLVGVVLIALGVILGLIGMLLDRFSER